MPKGKAGSMLIDLALKYSIPSEEYTPILNAFNEEKIEIYDSWAKRSESLLSTEKE